MSTAVKVNETFVARGEPTPPTGFLNPKDNSNYNKNYLLTTKSIVIGVF